MAWLLSMLVLKARSALATIGENGIRVILNSRGEVRMPASVPVARWYFKYTTVPGTLGRGARATQVVTVGIPTATIYASLSAA